MDVDPAAELVGARYVLVERIGQGGMANVWRAIDRTLEREVAVKTIDVNGEDHDQTLARFRREAIATAGLNDPHVVSVFDAGITEDHAYLVMELLEGPSLAPLVRAEPHLEVANAVVILRQVAQGLGAAHAIGITHRDVKPGNIVLHRGNAKIVDFGIARLTESLGEALTKTSTAIGTASYMSPEQALGSHVGPPSDIYALGAVAMALLTGQPPFTGGSVAVARAHVSDPPPRLRSRRAEVPPALDDLIAAMLLKDPEARPSALEVGSALARIHSAGFPPAGSVPSAPAPMRQPGPPSPAGAPHPGPWADGRPTSEYRVPSGPSGPSPSTGPRPLPPGLAPGPQGAPPHTQMSVPIGSQPPATLHMAGAFPPPPPGSVPVFPARSSSGSWWTVAALIALGIGAVILIWLVLSNL